MFYAELPELLASEHLRRTCFELYLSEGMTPHHPLTPDIHTANQLITMTGCNQRSQPFINSSAATW